jgi:2-oxoglutarate dehydrogenase E2 component (dihydrolipoamide succinyltransferase)
LVKSIAAQENISLQELESISGTGTEGRVTKKDILTFIENRTAAPVVSAQAAAPSAAGVVTSSANGVTAAAPAKPAVKSNIIINPQDEIIEMDRMRRLIADNMVMSKQVSPHVTSYVEADVTNIVNWRNRVKNSFEKRENEKITFTPIFIEAIVKAIKDFPMINISVDGTNIIKRGNINIGMAAALPNGNLIVPVIHNADRLNLLGLTKAVNDLANRARKNQLKSDEISGGTYTITNVGSFGNVMGTPIIPQPQVAILAVGAIRKMPAVIETPDGDFIGIRHKMFLSHAYDHRVVDGSLGGQFVRRVADYLENFDPKTEI